MLYVMLILTENLTGSQSTARLGEFGEMCQTVQFHHQNNNFGCTLVNLFNKKHDWK